VETVFTTGGYFNWKRATSNDKGFPLHQKSQNHMESMVRWQEFKKRKAENLSICQLMSDAHKKLVAENMHYVKTLTQVLRYTCTQKIAQRGHREHLDSSNKGNFLELMHLLAEKDPVVKEKLSKQQAKYTSPKIQNELVNIMAAEIRREIVQQLRQHGRFAIMVDESRDLSRKEQLSLCVRYLHDGTIHECFLGFFPAEELNAKMLAQLILEELKKNGIDIKQCVGQCYDGASVMSGCHTGVQSRISEVGEYIPYVHCYVHRLNLVLVDVSKGIAEAACFFSLVEAIYVFLSSSAVHPIWIATQQSLFPKEKAMELERLSDTRFTCRQKTCRTLKEKIKAVLAVLEKVSR
jgi:hypothetical protein